MGQALNERKKNKFHNLSFLLWIEENSRHLSKVDGTCENKNLTFRTKLNEHWPAFRFISLYLWQAEL